MSLHVPAVAYNNNLVVGDTEKFNVLIKIFVDYRRHDNATGTPNSLMVKLIVIHCYKVYMYYTCKK